MLNAHAHLRSGFFLDVCALYMPKIVLQSRIDIILIWPLSASDEERESDLRSLAAQTLDEEDQDLSSPIKNEVAMYNHPHTSLLSQSAFLQEDVWRSAQRVAGIEPLRPSR
jgi:hypothetical protein